VSSFFKLQKAKKSKLKSRHWVLNNNNSKSSKQLTFIFRENANPESLDKILTNELIWKVFNSTWKKAYQCNIICYIKYWLEINYKTTFKWQIGCKTCNQDLMSLKRVISNSHTTNDVNTKLLTESIKLGGIIFCEDNSFYNNLRFFFWTIFAIIFIALIFFNTYLKRMKAN
jgi:hypothetical protein